MKIYYSPTLLVTFKNISEICYPFLYIRNIIH